MTEERPYDDCLKPRSRPLCRVTRSVGNLRISGP